MPGRAVKGWCFPRPFVCLHGRSPRFLLPEDSNWATGTGLPRPGPRVPPVLRDELGVGQAFSGHLPDALGHDVEGVELAELLLDRELLDTEGSLGR